MSLHISAAVPIESRKLYRSTVGRVAVGATLAVVSLTSVGGYAAALHSPSSDLGRKSAAMVTAPGWAGYVGLSVLSLGVAALLAAGVVTSWVVGREFTDGTIVGLFALPTSRGEVASAKILAILGWGMGAVLMQSTVSTLGGLALGLPATGAVTCWGTLTAAGTCVLFTTLPFAWVATRWRGYLPGIGATLGVVVVTNLAAGFGLGRYIPWSIPIMWATPGSDVGTGWLTVPVTVGVLGAWATRRAWHRLQLGRS